MWDRFPDLLRGLQLEVIEARESSRERLNGVRDRRLGGVRKVHFPVDEEIVDFDVQRGFHSCRRAFEHNEVSPAGRVDHGQALALKPAYDLPDVRRARSELAGVLFGRQPVAILP